MYQPVIIAKNVSVKLQGNTVLDNVSFSLASRQHLAITGACGSGKTILAKVTAGKIFASGNMKINFDPQSSLAPKIQFIEQRWHFKNLSNISDFYYQQRFNSPDAENASTVMQELLKNDNKISNAETKIEHLITELGMQHRKDSPLIQLSSGEHKRFQLIKALINPPQILILDYPFIGLDIESRKKLHIILNTAAAGGTTIILITDVHEMPACLTHIAHLEAGRLIEFEKKEAFNALQIKHRYNNRYFHSYALPLEPSRHDFTNAVEMKNVTVKYDGKIILNNINWKIKRNEKWLIKGHNGAGKSVLLSLINGDNPQAYANEIYLFDKRRGRGESIWDIKKMIGYVSPELHASFDKNISCHDAIASGFFDTIGLYKKLSSNQQDAVQQWLRYLQLSQVQHKPLSSASSGNQRFIFLARALVKNPPLLILDEPCQGLDNEQKYLFVKLVDDLCKEFKKTLIYVSHYEDEIPECIQKVLILDKGIQKQITLKQKQTIAYELEHN